MHLQGLQPHGCPALWDPEELCPRESLGFPGELQTEPLISGCQSIDPVGPREPLKILEPDRACPESAFKKCDWQGER